MYPPSELKLTYEDDENVYFFTSAFYAFDNFSAHTVEIWGRTFPTSEHAYQWKKFEFTEPELADKILNARSTVLVKQLAHSTRNRDPEWKKKDLGIMHEIISAKAAQHVDVKKLLLSTESKNIIENSPYDSFWGCGPDGKGQNNLGKIWMKVRGELHDKSV